MGHFAPPPLKPSAATDACSIWGWGSCCCSSHLLLSMYAHRMVRRWDLWCRGYKLFMPLASSPRDAHCHLRRGFTTTLHCYYSQNSLHVAGLIALIRHFHIPPISAILPEYIILCRKRKCLSDNLKQSNCWKVGYYDSSDSGFQLHTVCF